MGCCLEIGHVQEGILIRVREPQREEATDEPSDAEAESVSPKEASPTSKEVETADPRGRRLQRGLGWGFTREPKMVPQKERGCIWKGAHPD